MSPENPEDDTAALAELASRMPRHRPWRPRVATIAVGFLLGAGVLGTILALRSRPQPSPRPSLAPLGPLLSASLAPRELTPHEQLKQLELLRCNAFEGPTGPASVLVKWTNGRVTSAAFATPAALQQGSFAARFAGTARGSCILETFQQAKLRVGPDRTDHTTIDVVVAPGTDDKPFDAAVGMLALDQIDASACGVGRPFRGIVTVTFLPTGAARVDEWTPAPTERNPPKLSTCVKDAFARAAVPPFADSEVTTSYWFATGGKAASPQ